MANKHLILTLTAAAMSGLPAIEPAWAQRSLPAESGEYNPVINPADFVREVTNKYFTLKPGKTFTYRNTAGTERIEISVTRETKQVMGVPTTVVRATEWKNGTLKEDTRDWYAQDKEGNVWYFGEWVDNYSDGKISDHSGSWEAGVKGAKPGILMLANPKVGDTYRQEYYKGHAEDMGTVVALDKKVKTRAGEFEDCLQVKDWSTIESATEYKYYCPSVGFLVMEESTSGGEKVELVGVSTE
jgi:hypothetical protein